MHCLKSNYTQLQGANFNICTWFFFKKVNSKNATYNKTVEKQSLEASRIIVNTSIIILNRQPLCTLQNQIVIYYSTLPLMSDWFRKHTRLMIKVACPNSIKVSSCHFWKSTQTSWVWDVFVGYTDRNGLDSINIF